jgi:hypothetical protein
VSGEFFIAPLQSPATHEIAHGETVRSRTCTGCDHSKEENERIDHA